MRPFGDDHYDGLGWIPVQSPALALRQALADEQFAPQEDRGSVAAAEDHFNYREE